MAKDPYKYFRIEAREILGGLSQGVLELEKDGAGKEPIAKLLRLAHTLKGASRVVKLTGIAEHAHALEDLLAPYRDSPGPIPADGINGLLGLLDTMTARIAAIDPGTEAETGTLPRARPDEPFETVRIEIEEMDRLLKGVTEATVQAHSLERESAHLEHSVRLAGLVVEQLKPRRADAVGATFAITAPARAHSMAEELYASLERLQRTMSTSVEQVRSELAQVRDAAHRLRLLPASSVFAGLERAARDVAQGLNKRIAFHPSGGDIRLDAHVLLALRDALLHVVRNAVAHGIEPESHRRSLGKNPTGHIALSVERRGSRVAFICRDDGQGVDLEAVRRAAVQRELVAATDAAALERDAVLALVLNGGLSTQAKVTEMAGRGIGLDVARETAARLKGNVSLRSEAGAGTSVEICVPISLSSLHALVVLAAGISASFPLDAVRSTLRLADDQITRSATSASIVFEGNVIPFFPLATALRQKTPTARRHWSTVVVQSGAALAAVGVDRLVGTASVVVRPLPLETEVDALVAGASLDAEGNPQLVLDPEGLVSAARIGSARAFLEGAPPKRRLLVVDDSLTTRMLEQSILESAGYEVDLAISGEEALAKAQDTHYGLFVVDVEMPGMDGYEFVTRTRADARLRETPAILVTSRASKEDRRRGEDAGAQAYIVKGEFDQAYLLQTIRSLVGDA
jgi:two-component system chemotaxis sensor kinase CheA